MRKSQHKKVPQRIIAGVVLVGLVMMGLFYTTRRTQAGWYDDNWAYRKVINITGHTTEEKNVYLNLTGGSALDSQGASKTNCGDIRFTDANGKVLPYFIVSGCKTASTVVHIFFDTFPAGAQTIYYYYGNPSARDGFSLTDFSTAATGVTFGSYGSQEVGPGPVVYWKFDEGYGTVINSNTQSGTPMTLTVGSGAPWTTEERCISGKCLYFNATGNVVASTSISNIKTVQFWVKPKTNAGTLFDADGTASVAYIVATNGTITAPGFTSPSFYINGVYTTTPTLVANVWQHITVTTNSSLSFSALTMGELTGPPTFTGFIDEVKLYRTVRTASEIKSDAQRWAGAEGSSAVLSNNTSQVGPLSNGLIGYWKMDESSWNNNCSTATVNDFSGNGLNLISCPSTTGPTGGGTGEFGMGGIFDGSNDYLESTSTTFNIAGTITLSAWVKPTAIPTGDVYVVDRSNNSQGYSLGWQGDLYPRMRIGNNSSYIEVTSSTAMAIGNWHHITGTVDSFGVGRVYLNGNLVATNNTGLVLTSSGQNLRIGGRAAVNTISGSLDEVKIFSRYLSPLEVKELYNWSPGPVGYWKMDEGVGQIAQDSSGNNNTGTLTNSPTWASGKYGSGVQFANGTTNKHISVPPASSLNNLTQLTYATWVKFTTNVDDVGLFGKSGNVQLYINEQATGQFRPKFAVTFSGDDLDIVLTDISNLSAGLWYHLAVTWDGGTSVNSARIYINGVEQTKHANSLPATGTKTDDSGNTFYIGNRASLVYQVNGAMDEAKVYNYVRSPSQIIEDMNAGHPAPGSPVGSPLLHLSFEEGYGDTAYDSSAQLNHGNMSGSTTCPSASICPTWSNEGKFGKAMYFGALQTADGDSHIRLTNDKYDTLTEGALSFWFKSDGVGTDNDIFGAAEDDNGTGSDFVGVLFNAQDSMLNLGISNNGSLALNVVTQAIPNTTAWHHAVVNMSSSGHEIYVDGKKQTLTYLSGNSSTALWFDDIAENTTAYTVGCSDFDGSDTNDCNGNGFFAGTIDEFKLFTQPLTQEQINIEFNGGVSQSMGAASTTSDGVTSSNSSSREYCPPGNTEGNCGTGNPAPVLRWKMDENAGTDSTYDTSGNNYTGTLNGTMTSSDWVQGKNGSALDFDGNDDSVQNTSISPPTGDFTYSIWIYPTAFSTSNAFIGLAQATIGGNEFMVDTDTDGDIDVVMDNGATLINGTNGLITLHKWHHVVVTRIGSTVTTYINGVPDVTAIDGDTLSLAPCGIRIGRNQSTTTCTSAGSNIFQGRLDDLQVYNYGRTAAQVAWDYNKGAPTHWYKFNECQGTTLYNSASTADGKATGLNGSMTLTGNSAGTCESVTSTDVWYIGENGKYGSAFGLDGNDYAVVATPALPTVDFTYATWIYVDTVNNDRPILKAADGAGGNEIKLEIMSDQGANPNKFRFAVDGTSIYSARAIQTGAWYHVVGRRTGSTMEMFINGQKDTVTGSDSTALSFSTCGLYIGAGPTSSCGGGISTYFDGMIDDLRIYYYALTDAQIKTVMNEGSAVRFGP